MTDRERFIPQRVGQLTMDLCSLPWPDAHDGPDDFRSFSRLIAALYHYEFHDREQIILEAWERVGDDPAAAALVAAELSGLLDGANYTTVTMAELDEALTSESLIGLRLEVDLDATTRCSSTAGGVTRTRLRSRSGWGCGHRNRRSRSTNGWWCTPG